MAMRSTMKINQMKRTNVKMRVTNTSTLRIQMRRMDMRIGGTKIRNIRTSLKNHLLLI